MNIEFALKRIALKPIKHKDCSALLAILSEPLVAQYNDYSLPLTRNDVKQLIQNDITGMYEGNTLRLGIYLIDTSTLIGCIGLYDIAEDSAWLGFELSANYWGQGFMSEALAFTLTNLTTVIALLGNEVSISNLQAKVATANSQSQRLLQRFNFSNLGYEHWLYKL